ncbi:MAG: hypothetical protein R3326_05295, partial [Gemmatimonadota bacterium]|nr:hypothetical protein [Gemmatimonadota bacterium]
MSDDRPTGPPIGGPATEDVPAWRLTTTLAVAGAIAGLAIVVVYQWAEPRVAPPPAGGGRPRGPGGGGAPPPRPTPKRTPPRPARAPPGGGGG